MERLESRPILEGLKFSIPGGFRYIYIYIFVHIGTTKLNFQSHPVFLMHSSHFQPRNFLAHALQHRTPDVKSTGISSEINDSWRICWYFVGNLLVVLLVILCYFLISLGDFPDFCERNNILNKDLAGSVSVSPASVPQLCVLQWPQSLLQNR